jgi:outer membrane immunogenic protein
LKFSLAVVLLAVSVASARAADLPAKIYTKAPLPPVAVYNWTGCYLGANGGGLWASKRWVNTDITTSALYGTQITSHTASGAMGGGQIGCDYQVGPWVFGIQGDYDAADARGWGIDNNNPRFNDESDVRGLGTVTLRAGYTVTSQFLLYARGGIAFERDRYNVYQLALPAITLQGQQNQLGLTATGDQDRTGGIVGLGGEYLITKNWSVFAEYNSLDFGTRTITLTSTQTQRPFITMDVRERKDVVRVGFNYRFNMATPVLANTDLRSR